MKTLFVITITLKKKYNLDAGFFTDTGHPVGRILDIREIRIAPQETLYSYDVETTEETYKALKDGKSKLYRIEEYSVNKCSTVYYNN